MSSQRDVDVSIAAQFRASASDPSSIHIGGVGIYPYGPRSKARPMIDSTALLEARNFKALRRRLRCQGYLYLRDVIPRDVVARTRVVVAEGLDSFFHCVEKVPEDAGDGSTESLFAPVMPSKGYDVERAPLLTGLRTVTHHPNTLRLLEGEELADLFANLFGEPAATLENKWVRIKGPSQFTDVHSDYYRFAGYALGLHTCWTALGDYNVSDGTLAVLQKSHVLRQVDHDAAIDEAYWGDEKEVEEDDEDDEEDEGDEGDAAVTREKEANESENGPGNHIDDENHAENGTSGAPPPPSSASTSSSSPSPSSSSPSPSSSSSSSSSSSYPSSEGKGDDVEELPPLYREFERSSIWRASHVAAGDVVIFDIKVVHASTQNEGKQFRLSLDSRWRPMSSVTDIRGYAVPQVRRKDKRTS